MHDPMTLAFSIKSPIERNGYRESLVDIWHVDPEKDGTDDSCGWFMRARHGDKKVLERIQSDFDFEYKYWFHEHNGMPKMSIHAIVLQMFSKAAWIYFGYNRKKHLKFMKDQLFEILQFAENPIDSLNTSIVQTYGESPKQDRIEKFASVIYGWILRETRPWWKHPRFHFRHYKINVIPLMLFKRWAFSRCHICKKGFKWGTSICTNSWNSEGPQWFKSERGVYHSECGGISVVAQKAGA